MEKQVRGQQGFYQLSGKTARGKLKGNVFSQGRKLIGRSESCDIIIDDAGVSSVHAIIEVQGESVRLFDMNSTNGTFVNGEKIVTKELTLNDQIRFSDVSLQFTHYQKNEELPPVLESLEPEKGIASVAAPPAAPEIRRQPKKLPQAPEVSKQRIPTIAYPLASDPKAESSEYIFEDAETIYPIFDYDTSKYAVEVIILFKDQVYSVDYLPEKYGVYQLKGALKKTLNEIEFPYLGSSETQDFIEIGSDGIKVYKLNGHDVFYLSDKEVKAVNQTTQVIGLGPRDILRFQNNQLEIYVRQVEAPPSVARAPFFRRDPEFRKYLLLFLFLAFSFTAALQVFDIEKEPDEEKAPERLATILYKKRPLQKTKREDVKVTQAEKKNIQKPKDPQPSKEPKPKQVPKPSKTTETNLGKKNAPKKQVVKKGTPKPTPKKSAAAKSSSSASKKKALKKSAASSKSRYKSKSRGPVDVYKSADFKSSVSNVLAKGGSVGNVKTVSANSGSGSYSAGTVSGNFNGGVKSSSISSDIGSLTGSATGKIGVSKGAESLSAKKGVFTAGIPAKTVVLGSMDPNLIRRVLLDNLPSFRYCYQSELESRGANLQGIVNLDFEIGASGRVTKVGLGQSSLPSSVKGCIARVLRGLQFPEPQGGGIVGVKQPMNFYSKNI